mmetsp:Transcript_1631/g.3180  ORF Transcript_1631/g.3180 Transcript_1631/m.3180 type:complete len:210 (-) Transcript_1631:620-1249(-)
MPLSTQDWVPPWGNQTWNPQASMGPFMLAAGATVLLCFGIGLGTNALTPNVRTLQWSSLSIANPRVVGGATAQRVFPYEPTIRQYPVQVWEAPSRVASNDEELTQAARFNTIQTWQTGNHAMASVMGLPWAVLGTLMIVGGAIMFRLLGARRESMAMASIHSVRVPSALWASPLKDELNELLGRPAKEPKLVKKVPPGGPQEIATLALG